MLRRVIWYARHGHGPADIDDRRAAEPWYRTKTEPAFEDMLIELRRTMIAARFRQAALVSPHPSKSALSSQPGKQPLHNYETSEAPDSMFTHCGVWRERYQCRDEGIAPTA